MSLSQKKRREIVLERDNHQCTECGSKKNLTIDHIIPKSKGGTNAPSNLITMCSRCNARKGSRIGWGFWERIDMAFHVEELLSNAKNELTSVISSRISLLKQEFTSLVQSSVQKLENVVNLNSQKILKLERKIQLLEQHLKVEFVDETQHIQEYRKIKK